MASLAARVEKLSSKVSLSDADPIERAKLQNDFIYFVQAMFKERMDLKGEYPILAITVVDGSMKRSERYSANGVGRDGSKIVL